MGKPKIERDIVRYEEMKQILENAPDLKIQSLLTFLYLFGCRISETYYLKKEDFLVNDGKLRARIRVLKREQQRKRKICYDCKEKVHLDAKFCPKCGSSYFKLLDLPKSDSIFRHNVAVGLRAPFMNIIMAYLDTKKDGEYLWRFSDNRESNCVLVWQAMKKVNPNIWPHLFRHTRATKIAEKGATEQQLRIWFGWKSTKTASTYVQASEKLIEDLADKID